MVLDILSLCSGTAACSEATGKAIAEAILQAQLIMQVSVSGALTLLYIQKNSTVGVNENIADFSLAYNEGSKEMEAGNGRTVYDHHVISRVLPARPSALTRRRAERVETLLSKHYCENIAHNDDVQPPNLSLSSCLVRMF